LVSTSDQKDAARTGHEPADASAEPPKPPRLLDRRTLIGISWKILILEALWNPRGQQSIGLLTVIDRALKVILAGRPAALKEARKRSLDFFNTNPVASGLVIGAVLRLEEEQANGELDPETGRKLVQALSSTLAAEGDQFFWQSWLPTCCLLGVLATSLTGLILAPLLTPLLFCAVAWPVRLWGVFKGYELGCDVYRVYQQIHGQRLILALQWFWMIILAGLTSAAAMKVFSQSGGPGWRTLFWAGLSIAALWLYRRVCFGHRRFVSYLLYPVLLAVLCSLAASLG
jgi:mannose/fructose/N-acetylgalactosamine-specific phosphotransferase system component IID